MSKDKLCCLFVGDGPTAIGESGKVEIYTTGFGVVTKNTVGGLIARGYDVHLLGLNYGGDPHNLDYPIYCPSSHRRDEYGLLRVVELCLKLKPDVVFINNDLWICERFANELSRLGDKQPGLVCYIPTDAEGHCPPHVAWMHRCHTHMGQAFRVIPYTYFGKSEWYKAGYGRTSAPIGHGLDPIYKEKVIGVEMPFAGDENGNSMNVLKAPVTWEDIQKERVDARIEFAQGGIGPDTFVVMNNDRNSERKRWDIIIDAFVRFAAMVKKETGTLFCSGQDERIAALQAWMDDWDRWNAEPVWTVGPDDDEGNEMHIPRRKEPERPEYPDPLVKLWAHTKLHDNWDLTHLYQQACKREGLTDIEGEICFMSTTINDQDVAHGDITAEMMRRIYLAVAQKGCYVKAAHGEGFGFGPLEAAACGSLLVLPENTVNPELYGDIAYMAKCPHYGVAGPMSLTWRSTTQEILAKELYGAWQVSRAIGTCEMVQRQNFNYAMSERFDWDKLVDRFAGEIEAAAAGRKKEVG